MDINAVIARFIPDAQVVECRPYGHGHINETFFVRTAEHGKYILQCINTNIFRNVDGLMNNVKGVTEYIYRLRIAAGDKPEDVLKLYPTVDGAPYARVDEKCYRLYNYIEGALDTDTMAVTPELFRLSGVGFGKFQNLLNGYNAEQLCEPIPNFHNTRVRLNDLIAAAERDAVGRKAEVEKELQFYLSRASYADRVLNLLNEGKMPLRVTHNDTKLNNVLIDGRDNRVLSIIDLDTVMPGSILYDFGDSIRFGANTAAEDETDLGKVTFSAEMFRAFCEGFLPEVANVLTNAEVDEMAFGALLMTYECGMRFLTDYLNGDTYFRTHRPTHNLDRARTQAKLLRDMEAQLPAMEKVVKSIVRKPHPKDV